MGMLFVYECSEVEWRQNKNQMNRERDREKSSSSNTMSKHWLSYFWSIFGVLQLLVLISFENMYKIWWTHYGGSTKWLTVYSRQCRKKLKAFAEYNPKQDTKIHLYTLWTSRRDTCKLGSFSYSFESGIRFGFLFSWLNI